MPATLVCLAGKTRSKEDLQTSSVQEDTIKSIVLIAKGFLLQLHLKCLLNCSEIDWDPRYFPADLWSNVSCNETPVQPFLRHAALCRHFMLREGCLKASQLVEHPTKDWLCTVCGELVWSTFRVIKQGDGNWSDDWQDRFDYWSSLPINVWHLTTGHIIMLYKVTARRQWFTGGQLISTKNFYSASIAILFQLAAFICYLQNTLVAHT